MEFLGYHYYKLYRISLLPLGLWPYDGSFFKQIQVIIWIFLLISSPVTQLLKLFTTEYNLEFVLTDLSFAIPSMIHFWKYITFYIQSQKFRELMEQIQNDWNALKDEQEFEIIRKYAKFGRRYLYAFAGLAYPSTVAFILTPLLPDILDIVAPLNESRTRHLPFVAEYFLDEQIYFYPILLHMNVTLAVGMVTTITTEALFFACVYHICSMFEIVSYRIDYAFNKSISILSTLNRENAIRMKIIDAIEIHQRTIEFFEYLMSTVALSYFILIILGVASLSINLFRFFQIAVLPDQRKQTALFLTFIIGHFYYMFICNYMGQKILDKSIGISEKTYNTQWYMVPVQTQKLLLFMLQRSMKSCKFVIGGIYSVSLENFTTLVSMSLSYFTVIYSTQQ